jgi:hypothetical protein
MGGKFFKREILNLNETFEKKKKKKAWKNKEFS